MTAAVVGVVCFVVGYIAGSLSLIFAALMIASSERHRMEDEDDL